MTGYHGTSRRNETQWRAPSLSGINSKAVIPVERRTVLLEYALTSLPERSMTRHHIMHARELRVGDVWALLRMDQKLLPIKATSGEPDLFNSFVKRFEQAIRR